MSDRMGEAGSDHGSGSSARELGEWLARRKLSRRQVMAAGLGTGAALLMDSCGSSVVKKAVEACPAGGSLTDVEHIVVLMIENRSFDHFFGAYRGVRGFDDHPASSLGAFSQPWPGDVADPPAERLLPYHLDTLDTSLRASIIGNVDVPTHDWAPQHMSWAGGAMDAFVKTHAMPQYDKPAYAPLVMGYYERSDLPFWYALADSFTLLDNYYCSVLGPTMPNRLCAMSGTIDPGGRRGGPIMSTPSISGPGDTSDVLFTCSWPTMFEGLESNGIPWKVYQQPGSSTGPIEAVNLAVGFNALLYFKQYQDPSSSLYKKAFLPSWPADFEADVSRGELPAVSWLIPPLIASAHPPAPPELGAWMVARVLDALSSNRAVWEKTVLIVTFDENGGFFDHVPPPTPPPGTPGEELTVRPLPADARGISGPVGLGFRVPTLVISPFSRGGWVNSDTFDHTSILRLIETRFGVEAPNLSEWRRRTVGDLTTTVDFAKPEASVPSLPPAPLDAPSLLAQDPAGRALLQKASPLLPLTAEILLAIEPLAFQTPNVPPPPDPQKMAVQERGTARRRRIEPCAPSQSVAR